MARLKRIAIPAPSVKPLTLDEVLDGPRPGRGDPERDRVWLDLRAAVGRASCGHPRFDLRLMLAGGPAWHEARREWLADVVFRDDPRVVS